VTTTDDTLRTTLGETAFGALRCLAVGAEPLSGRQIASVLKVSPTTATAALAKLRDAGFAMSSQEGRAQRWRLNTDNAVIRSWLEETRDEMKAPEVAGGSSPYSTAGGGITFERKVGVRYLARLLAGDGAVELGDGRVVVGVDFQQAPDHQVDDLVIRAARADEDEPSLVLAVAARRSPNLVPSDKLSRKLICAFIREVANAPADGPEHRCALAVAGDQAHARQLAVLADHALSQKNAPAFFRLIRAHGKFNGGVCGRLEDVEALVKLALADLGVADPGQSRVEESCWELLSKLTVLFPRFETPDQADWAEVANSLIPVADGWDLLGATRLRDLLLTLADEYAPKAATVDLTMLRRAAHAALDSAKRRHRKGWRALALIHDSATVVRNRITSEDGSRAVRVDRSGPTAELLALARSAASVVAHGESGVGKSALVVAAAVDAAAGSPGDTQAVCVNLRHLPRTGLELEAYLGAPLAVLLSELSAPQRLLVVDGADALPEGAENVFRYLAGAARLADVTVIAVTAGDARQLVRDVVAECRGGDVTEYLVPPLTDAEVDQVTAVFGELAHLGANPRSRELLRRPVVVDLLVRGEVKGTPLSDADAMEQVWAGLVLRQGRTDRGRPYARNIALLNLADFALRGGDPLEVVSRIDQAALDGLIRDGLLRMPADDPFGIGPEFAHDEVRRYAVARLLLSEGDPAAKLAAAGVPRWSLGAARLACQALLAGAGTAANPAHGRLARMQQAFDGLVVEGHGDRWGDVPGEAVLTLGDPGPVLRDAWAGLRAGPDAGLKRLSRLVDQRLTRESSLVRADAVEPLIGLLLGDGDAAWMAEKHLRRLVRNWLRSLAAAGTPAGHPLRVRLREQLTAACAAGDSRLQAERDAAAAVRAARSAAEIEEERELRERHRHLLSGPVGFPRGRRRRPPPQVPREITDETMIELLALIGPDLGDPGEAILVRVARDAPSKIGPAVETLLGGCALAGCRRGILAQLTEAYYLDEEEDGSGFHEDGIRDHDPRRASGTPLAAWYRGPFLFLFRTDFRNGVGVLNRMLNHAARARERTLAGHGSYGPVDEGELDARRLELGITGIRHAYAGDSQTWTWYRGTGSGPFPCMSALQALERVCEELIAAEVPLENIVTVLMDGCENLAMPGLVVALLVRHLEDAGRLLDPYLAEPHVWDLEFFRIVHEGLLAASSEGLANPERRRWSLSETAMLVALGADEPRADELRETGRKLVASARRLAAAAPADEASQAAADQWLANVRAWAAGLDRSTYQVRREEGAIYIQSTPPGDITAARERNGEELRLAGESTRLMVRYHVQPSQGTAIPLTAEDLAADLAVAGDLLASPPALAPTGPWDAPAAVAATALEAALGSAVAVPDDYLRLAAETVIRVGEGEAPRHPFDGEDSQFGMGADRSAARALPLLLLPGAARLLALVDGADGLEARSRATAAALRVARSVPNEVRVHLTRGTDRLWEAPCTGDESCHHRTALELAVETMRDCVIGAWDPNAGRRQAAVLADPVEQALAGTADDAIDYARLDAPIRALAPAAQADVCVSGRARELLAALLAAHRRSLLACERDPDHRGTHALIAARALLTLAAGTDGEPVREHLDAYADNPPLLVNFLEGLSAAAEESPGRAATAARIWPSVVAHVIGLHREGHVALRDPDYGDYALASLMPNRVSEIAFFHRELGGEPIAWWQPLAWQDTVEQWIPLAQGNPACVSHLIGFLQPLPTNDQARAGLPWVERLVLADPGRVARRASLLSSWLIEVRQPASDADLLADWQRVVDALVVAGVSRLAPYSE
jgi:DNA-binding transcriptional ArsR family regulator